MTKKKSSGIEDYYNFKNYSSIAKDFLRMLKIKMGAHPDSVDYIEWSIKTENKTKVKKINSEWKKFVVENGYQYFSDSEIKKWWDRNYNQKFENQFSSQGHKKLWSYFLEILKSDYFQNYLSRTRKQYGIPKNGYRRKNIHHPPEMLNEANHLSIEKDTDRMCKRFGLHRLDFAELFEEYLLYGKVQPYYYESAYNVCVMADLKEIAEEPFGDKITEDDNNCYPVAIRLSPFATKRDILDFVNKNYKTGIKPRLDFYRLDQNLFIGKIKSKPKGERNDFIFKNRKLKNAKIAQLVNEKFSENLIYLDIENIIQQEQKRRKKL